MPKLLGRFVSPLFLVLISVCTAGAQTKRENSVPPVEVLKLKWEKQARLPRNFDPSIIPTGGAFNDPGSMGSSSSVGSGNSGDGSRNSSSRPTSTTLANFPATPGRLPVFYVYSMKIRNDGEKQIDGIAWDYLLLDPQSGVELGRHQFVSYVKTPSGGTATLKGQARTAPIRIVEAPNSEKRRVRPIERVAIQCVLFSDDTTWRNPFGRPGICEFLKNSETVIKQRRGNTQH
jgi:hypothetical protein